MRSSIRCLASKRPKHSTRVPPVPKRAVPATTQEIIRFPETPQRKAQSDWNHLTKTLLTKAQNDPSGVPKNLRIVEFVPKGLRYTGISQEHRSVFEKLEQE